MSAKRRIDQIFSSLGLCSRKEAQGLCDQGRVKVKGALVDDASQRVAAADVTIDDEPLDFPDGLFILLNKPTGYVCSLDSREGARVYDLLPEHWQLRDPKVVTVGRLDKDTSGLLLITDQGQLVHKLTSPKHLVDKVYEATVRGGLTPELIGVFQQGVQLEDEEEPCRPAGLRLLSPTLAEVTLHEGKYHQVRRMFAAHGVHVEALKRVRVGDWTLEGVAEGEWRALEWAGL